MSTKASYVNNFAMSIQNLVCILEAQSTAPNIEKSNFGTLPVFDARKVVDETYLYMPIEVAKELSLSILQMVSEGEKRSGLHVRLSKEKQAMWEAAVKGLNEYQETQKEGKEEQA